MGAGPASGLPGVPLRIPSVTRPLNLQQWSPLTREALAQVSAALDGPPGGVSVRPCACRHRLPVCALPWTDSLVSERLLPPLLSAPAGPNSGKASVGRSAKHPTVRLYDTAHQLWPRTSALKGGLLSGAREIRGDPLRRRPHRSAIIAGGSNVQPVFAKPDLDSAGCSFGMLLTGNVCCDDSGV